jgi:hypothetical protein
MIRIITKLFAVTVALTVCLPVQPSSAGNIAYVSATGGGSACTQTAPCATIEAGLNALPAAGGRVVCLTAAAETAGMGLSSSGTYVFDCPSASWLGGLTLVGSGVFKFQHIGFSGIGSAPNVIHVTVIFDDCVLEDVAGTALDIEPSGPFNLVMKNSRISNNAGGVLIKPIMGASVTATFDGVTILNNTGGLKTDSTNGAVRVDVSNSTISNNTANGVNIIGGAGGTNMVTLKNVVIASNGQAGIVASGANAAVLVNNTVLDSNTAGATSAVAGGRILTYGNNSIIGALGSGFTSSTPLQ